MIDAGIKDPDSQEGINFCIEKCPYDECRAVIQRLGIREAKEERMAKALKLHSQGYSKRKIAEMLGVQVITVNRYLAE